MITWKDIKHFKSSEFNCPCCGKNEMDINFVKKLDDMRALYGNPLKVESGYRCDKHNKEVGGVADSDHEEGKGVDFTVNGSVARYTLIGIAYNMKIKRIGVGKTFIHFGVSEKLPQFVMWTYYK